MGENVRAANGLRRSPFYTLTAEDIAFVKDEIKAIGADESVFIFNGGRQTGYVDDADEIFIRGDVFPGEGDSIHPRDLLSVRAVLAHEYYGHRAYRGTDLPKGSWQDEYRASYTAAKNAPCLTDEDRRCLILDAKECAKEAGFDIPNNDFMRRFLYGY